jgi:outer membrane protein assembly factor BamB
VVVLLLVLGLGACGEDPYDGATEAPGGPDAATTDDSVPTTAQPGEGVGQPTPESVDFAAEWPLPGRDHSNTRAVPDSPITSETIDSLEVAWSVDLPGFGSIGNAATTPVVADGVVYLQDLSSNVRAIDLESGEVLWEQIYDTTSIGPNGATLGHGMVFVAKGMFDVAALDAETGEEVWTAHLSDGPEGIDIQPQVFGGLVLVSTVPISLEGIYAGGSHGVLHALDVETGDVVWTFDTVDDGDEVWGNPEVNSGGGSWFPPSVDPATGTVYWGVANPAPFPGTPEFPNGTSRPGPNLYSNSVVALDGATGELQWYQQAIEHDLFDRDLIHTLVAEGDDGPVVVGTGKLGRVIGHDQTSGDVLWDTPVGLHENDELTELDGPTTIAPGTYGGVISPPATADGVIYTAVLNAPTELTPDATAYFGAEMGQMPGAMSAVDATTGELLWEVEVDGDPLGGALVVGDLVLTGTYQGTFFAFDRETGDEVWQMEAPGGVNGWPVAVDDQLLWPVGLSEPAQLLSLRLSDTGEG